MPFPQAAWIVVHFRHDRRSRRIGVATAALIGNGIAGMTAADHIRRRHPDCESTIGHAAGRFLGAI